MKRISWHWSMAQQKLKRCATLCFVLKNQEFPISSEDSFSQIQKARKARIGDLKSFSNLFGLLVLCSSMSYKGHHTTIESNVHSCTENQKLIKLLRLRDGITHRIPNLTYIMSNFIRVFECSFVTGFHFKQF